MIVWTNLRDTLLRSQDYIFETIGTEMYASKISCHYHNPIYKIRSLKLTQDAHSCTRLTIIIFPFDDTSRWFTKSECIRIMCRFWKIFFLLEFLYKKIYIFPTRHLTISYTILRASIHNNIKKALTGNIWFKWDSKIERWLRWIKHAKNILNSRKKANYYYPLSVRIWFIFSPTAYVSTSVLLGKEKGVITIDLHSGVASKIASADFTDMSLCARPEDLMRRSLICVSL